MGTTNSRLGRRGGWSRERVLRAHLQIGHGRRRGRVVELHEERRAFSFPSHHEAHEPGAGRDDQAQRDRHRGGDVDDLLLARARGSSVPLLHPLAVDLAAGVADESLVAVAPATDFARASVLAVGVAALLAEGHELLLAARAAVGGNAVARLVGVASAQAAVLALVADGIVAVGGGHGSLATRIRKADGAVAAAASFALSGVAAPTAANASSDAGDAAINPLGGVRAVTDVVARRTVPRVARAAVEASVIAVFIYDGGDARAWVAVGQAGAISRERARRRQGEEQNGAEAEGVRPHRCP